jgi:hypothetical protein
VHVGVTDIKLYVFKFQVDLLSGQMLPPDWRVVDRELESKMAAEMAVIPLTYGGMTLSVVMSQVLLTSS